MYLVDEEDYLFVEDLVFNVEVMLLDDELREFYPMVDEVIQQLSVFLAVAQELVFFFFDHVLECRSAEVDLVVLEDVVFV